MIASAIVENIVIRHADAIRRDAEALAAVVAWADCPAGVAVVPLDLCGDGGATFGSGHLVAQAHGLRAGVAAVAVDVAGILAAELAAAPGDPAAALVEARLLAEWVAVHEVAHAIVARLDPTLGDQEAAEVVDAAFGRGSVTSAEGTAISHDARWAGAAVILQRRAARLRPARERGTRTRWIDVELDFYGHPLAVAGIVEAVADDATLRDILAPGAPLAEQLVTASRPLAERAAIIDKASGACRGRFVGNGGTR